MLHNLPELPQHIYLALDHHQELLKDAKRYREADAAQRGNGERPLRWRGLRYRIGELLIDWGQRIAGRRTDASVTGIVTGIVWG